GEGLTLVHPPSIIKVCPVICLASSETKNAAALAISWTSAARPNGVIFDHVFLYSGSKIVLFVIVAPGAMVLTRILNGASSSTKFFASISSAALLIAYAARFSWL